MGTFHNFISMNILGDKTIINIYVPKEAQKEKEDNLTIMFRSFNTFIN